MEATKGWECVTGMRRQRIYRACRLEKPLENIHLADQERDTNKSLRVKLWRRDLDVFRWKTVSIDGVCTTMLITYILHRIFHMAFKTSLQLVDTAKSIHWTVRRIISNFCPRSSFYFCEEQMQKHWFSTSNMSDITSNIRNTATVVTTDLTTILHTSWTGRTTLRI